MGHDLFFSHSTSVEADQRELLDELARLLEAQGLSVFLDRRVLAGGEELIPTIEAAIRGARLGVIVISTRALASGWVALEIDEMLRRALAGRLRLVGVRLERGCPAPRAAGDLEVLELGSYRDIQSTARRLGEILGEESSLAR